MIFDQYSANESSTRYGRVCRLVIEGGTKAVREFVLQHLHPVRLDGLPATLRALKELFDKLKRDSIITTEQFDTLYPNNNQEIEVDDIDLSLWVILFRNATLVNDRIFRRQKVKLLKQEVMQYVDVEKGNIDDIKPKSMPKYSHESFETLNKIRSDVFKIKDARNYLFHKSKHEIELEEFEKLWWKVAEAILELRKSTPHCNNDMEFDIINKFKTNDLDQTSTANSVFLVQKQSLNELRCLALKEVNRKRWTVAALLIHFVLVITTIVGVIGVIYIYSSHQAARRDDPGVTDPDHFGKHTDDVTIYPPADSYCVKAIKLVDYGSKSHDLVKFLPRSGWAKGAEPTQFPMKQKLMIPKYVLVAHTPIIDVCLTTDECCSDAEKIRVYDINNNYGDITYNGLVCDSGVILEGCGFETMSNLAVNGSQTVDKRKWREESLYFGFMGIFNRELPNEVAILAFKKFLKYLVKENKLSKDFIIYAECQVNKDRKKSPGLALYNNIKTWSHWENTTTTYCDPVF